MNGFKSTFHAEGVVSEIREVESFPSGFKKQTVVIDGTNNPKYPNKMDVEFMKEKLELVEALQIGDTVSVDGFLSGREWNSKYFKSLNAQTIVRTNVRNDSAPAQRREAPKHAQEEDDSSGLPF